MKAAVIDLNAAPQILAATVTLNNSVDRSLMDLYPRWRAAMAEWDALCDQIEKSAGDSYVLRRGLATVSREREALETQILAATGSGPIGAIVKLATLRTIVRSGETDATRAATAEAIAVLALAHGIEPYDYRSAS